MTSRCLALLFSIVLAAGCSKQASERPAPNINSPAFTAANRPATTPKAAEKPGKTTRLNQDGTETVEDTSAGDSGAHNPLLAAVAATITGTSSASAQSLNGPTLWQEGVNYTRLVPAQPTNVPAGQIEVLEFFWYACPHCYALEPRVDAWLKNKPANVTFVRVPVLWNEGHRSLARLYYTLDTMGKINELHPAIFKEIHVTGNPLIGVDPNNTAESERVQAMFVRKFNIVEDEFRKNYHSMAVDTAMQRAASLVERYRVTSVPTFVVNGKYVTDEALAGSPERLLNLIGDLAAGESKR
jgi:protein dithiol oxidoreductase (disulfide-forming)